MGQQLMGGVTLHKRLLDHLRTAVVMLDHNLQVRYLNPAAEMLLATSVSRAMGQPLPDYFFDDEEARDALRQCIQDEHPFTRREARLAVAPGYEITVDYSVSPINEPGQTLSLLMEMQPLDRLLRITREEALIHAHQATRALVRGVAHEIKNPLGGIRGAAQLLERALPDPDLTEYTKVIIDEADRLRTVADRMLGPRKPPEFKAVNVHECLEHVRQLLLAEHPQGVAIWRDYDISLPDVIADRDQMIQVLLNIIRNATHAHPGIAPVHHWFSASPSGVAGGYYRQRPGYCSGCAGDPVLSHGQWPGQWYRAGIVHCPVHHQPASGADRVRKRTGQYRIQYFAANGAAGSNGE